VLAVSLAASASLTWGVGDFVAALASRRRHVLTVALLSQAAGFLLMLVVVPAAWPGPPNAREVGFGLGAGLVGSIGLLALYRGMAIGAIGVVAPIAATGASIPVAVGLASGDRPSAAQLVGVAAAFVGVVLAAREPGAAEAVGRSRLATGVGLALVAAASGGIFLTFLDQATDHGDALWAAFFAKVGDLVAYAAAAAVIAPPLAVGRRDFGVLSLVGLLDTLGIVLFALATTKGLVSLVAVVASLYPVSTIVLARVVLGERIGLVQRAGAAAALGGAALIAAG
jgi:drug/metabolite transporter (DMT)-like permease